MACEPARWHLLRRSDGVASQLPHPGRGNERQGRAAALAPPLREVGRGFGHDGLGSSRDLTWVG